MTEEKDKCPICLDELEDKNIVVLNCKHIFCINCYTQYVIHKVKDILHNFAEENVQCPMCRESDTNMIVPIIETVKDSIEIEEVCKISMEDVEDLFVKQFYPHIYSLIDGNRRFTKRNFVFTLKRILKDNEKALKYIIRDFNL